MTRIVGVFLATALADVVWARYIRATADRKAVSAASWSALVVLLGAYATVSIVADRWLVLPALCGAFVGTYYAVRA